MKENIVAVKKNPSGTAGNARTTGKNQNGHLENAWQEQTLVLHCGGKHTLKVLCSPFRVGREIKSLNLQA